MVIVALAPLWENCEHCNATGDIVVRPVGVLWSVPLREYCGGAKGAACGHSDGNVVVLWSFWWHCGHFDGTDYGGTVVSVVVPVVVPVVALRRVPGSASSTSAPDRGLSECLAR